MGRQKQRSNRKTKEPPRRDFVILIVFFFIFLAVLTGIVFATVVNGPKFAAEAYKKQVPLQTIYAKRGTIYDRNGSVIATTTAAYSVYADPKTVEEPDKIAPILERYFGAEQNRKASDYEKLLTTPNTSFVYINREVDDDVGDALKAELKEQKLKGIGFLEESKRIYPYEETGAQVIGNLRRDDSDMQVGNCGLEMQYEDILCGTNGSRQVEYGRDGTPVAMGKNAIVPAKDGEDIMISLDMKIQKFAEERLVEGMEKSGGTQGSVTVLDGKSGEIYAACSYSMQDVKSKEKDGSETTEKKIKQDAGKIWSITDSYEPGSTFKTISACSIFTNSDVTADSSFDVPSSLNLYGSVIKDSHEHGNESMTFREIIARSSNMGTVMAAQNVTGDQLYQTIQNFQFTRKPKTDFPGAARGYIEKPDDWDPVQKATISFGQGLSVTGLQLTNAYGAIQQGGQIAEPHFLIGLPHNSEKATELMKDFTQTTTAESEQTCSRVGELLNNVVENGTGTSAQVEGYSVAGKTGTAQIASETGGYDANNHYLSFVGYLAGSSSNLVCLVTMKNPDGNLDGGTVCGPIFADIMSFVADTYQVNP